MYSDWFIIKLKGIYNIYDGMFNKVWYEDWWKAWLYDRMCG
jgi:hypothetical protein